MTRDRIRSPRGFNRFDGNGNVSEYLGITGNNVSHYEYDPSGTLTRRTGSTSTRLQYRFSTKPRDVNTGLYYYGYRWYDPVTGRWPSRDPIEERGGVNLYGFVGNAPQNRIDVLGLQMIAPPVEPLPINPYRPNPYETPIEERDRKTREAYDPRFGFECRDVDWKVRYRSRWQYTVLIKALTDVATLGRRSAIQKGVPIPKPRPGDYVSEFISTELPDNQPMGMVENLNGFTMLDGWVAVNQNERPKPELDEFEISERKGIRIVSEVTRQIIYSDDQGYKTEYYVFAPAINTVTFCKISCRKKDNQLEIYPSAYE